ncbi:MAG: THUMP domain-containing protein [Candidatus Hodarchaeota archaeon]
MSLKDKSAVLLNKRVILIRMGGEIGIKSRQTRRRMVRNLQNDIKRHLEDYPSLKVVEFRDRLIIYFDSIESNKNLNELIQLITTSVSGISSASSALVTESTEKKIVCESLAEFKKIIQPNSSFAVRVRREGNHPFSSMEIAQKTGSAILNSQIKDLKVDLDTPNFQLFLDIRGALTFIYTQVHRGIDGIPSLSQGIALAMVKPNYNSLLASWLMKKRGVKIIPIFFKTGKPNEKEYLEYIKAKFDEDITIITLTDRLYEFKDNSSLCMLCQLYCEKCSENTSNDLAISTLISPTCFNYHNETMSLKALKILEENISKPVLRPIQLGFYGDFLKDENFDLNPCCEYRSQISIHLSADFNENSVKKFLSFKARD